MRARFAVLAAILLALCTLGARAETNGPPPGTWGIGVLGGGNIYTDGQPSVRYVATDRLSLELIPNPIYSYQRTGALKLSSKNFDIAFDIIERLASYKGFNLNALVEPQWVYQYQRTDNATGPSKLTFNSLTLGAGLELEYFLRPELSIGARGMFSYAYARSNGTNASPQYAKSFNWTGQGAVVHYYFMPPSAEEPDVKPAGAGAWAVGWQGTGNLYNDSTPLVRYAFSDKNAIEESVTGSWNHSTSGNTNSHTQSLFTYTDWIHRLAVRGPVVFSSVVELEIADAYSKSQINPGFTRTSTLTLSPAAGFEIEYFVMPQLSLGARALLYYFDVRASNYSAAGYGGQSLNQFIALQGQILSARLYFGGSK